MKALVSQVFNLWLSAAKNVEGMNIACLQVGTLSALGE